ncbi:MAG: hypothetical protein PVI57_16575 [Gemmatimonadota bacterium]|jgi:hypothetical protein
MRHLTAAVTLVTLVFAPAASAQRPPGQDFGRPDAFVAATATFSFFSDPRVNLHDLLVWRLESRDPVDPRPGCLDRLDAPDGEAFRRAAGFYRDRLSAANRDRRDVLIDLRFHLIGHPEVEIAPDSVVDAAVEHLDAALPAYRACWWGDHDARNRRWIAGVVPRVRAVEDSLTVRLARLYQGEWVLPIPVDVAGRGSRTGANTVLDPDHILVGTALRAYDGNTALEIVFHEASHTLVGPRSGAVARALGSAAREAGVERLPPELWHVVLFYTTGRALEALLAERGTDYHPYLYSEGLFDRAWPELREPMERHWQPYLDGRIGMDEAARRLLRAIREDRGG